MRNSEIKQSAERICKIIYCLDRMDKTWKQDILNQPNLILDTGSKTELK